MSETATPATWTARGPWASILKDGPVGAPGAAGVCVRALAGLGVATLVARPGHQAALAAAVAARFNLTLPAARATSCSPTHRLMWAGADQWLLVARDRARLADDIAFLADRAAVSDQSDGRAALGVSGPKARQALSKGCMIDLHPTVFPVDATAMTSIAHVGVHLWRATDSAEGAAFEMLVARSMAGSFWSWLSAAAAEFGCTVSDGHANSAGYA